MKTTVKILALALILSSFGCEKGKSFDPANASIDDIDIMSQIEDDLKNQETDDDSKKESIEYCEALEQKMKTLDKESTEMAEAWKLYTTKCEGKKDKKEKDGKEKGSYCDELNAKLKKLTPGTSDYNEVQDLISKKCTE